MIKVNGKPVDGFDGKTVSELVNSLGYKTEYIAVEINGDILKRDAYASTTIKENDAFEVVSFVGGG